MENIEQMAAAVEQQEQAADAEQQMQAVEPAACVKPGGYIHNV